MTFSCAFAETRPKKRNAASNITFINLSLSASLTEKPRKLLINFLWIYAETQNSNVFLRQNLMCDPRSFPSAAKRTLFMTFRQISSIILQRNFADKNDPTSSGFRLLAINAQEQLQFGPKVLILEPQLVILLSSNSDSSVKLLCRTNHHLYIC
jgi:hypothetical protein